MNIERAGLALTTIAVIAVIAVSGCTASDPASAGSDRLTVSRPLLWPDLTSNLDIPAGERFVFAGGQSEPFTAFVTNQGDVPVTIVEDLLGTRSVIAVVPQGARASYRFDPRAAALFENPSEQSASVKVEVWGPTQVGMRYTKIGA